MQLFSSPEKENFYENDYAEYWISHDILYQVFKPGTVLTLDVGKEVVADRIKVSGQKELPLLIDINYVISIDRKTQNFMASEAANSHLIAAAFILNNVLSRLHFNTFMKFTKRPIPMKGFTSPEQALKWLEHFKDVNDIIPPKQSGSY